MFCGGYVLLRLLEKHNALQLFFSVLFCFSATFFWEYRGIWSKKYFTDHRKATILLSVAIKGNCSGLLEREFTKDNFIDVTAFFFAYY